MSDISALSLEQSHLEIVRLLALIGQKEQTIESLQHQLHLFRTARFGRKSEKRVVSEQLALQFDEAIPAEEAGITNTTETITYNRNKKGTGRKSLPKSLPYIEKIHDLSDAEKQCSCGCTLTHIRDEITEQLPFSASQPITQARNAPQAPLTLVRLNKTCFCPPESWNNHFPLHILIQMISNEVRW